jgi:hypothetical protein
MKQLRIAGDLWEASDILVAALTGGRSHLAHLAECHRGRAAYVGRRRCEEPCNVRDDLDSSLVTQCPRELRRVAVAADLLLDLLEDRRRLYCEAYGRDPSHA